MLNKAKKSLSLEAFHRLILGSQSRLPAWRHSNLIRRKIDRLTKTKEEALLEYDKTYITQQGASVGERGSLTRVRERWFSRRHSRVERKADFPKSQDSRLGSSGSEVFPQWSVWLPGQPFPEHPDNRARNRSSGQPKK